MLPYNKRLKPFSRELRKKMTEAEQRLWSRVRRKQLKDCTFNRQKIIGPYIVDFYCNGAKLIVELDGGQHYHGEGLKQDKVRDQYFTDLGLHVLRFSDREVFKNMEGALERICEYL